jgi:hypothetical protein
MTTTSARKATTDVAPPVVAPSVVAPPVQVRLMLVRIPDDLPGQVLTYNRRLDRAFGVSATSCPRLWASPRLHAWQRRRLFDVRTGHPTLCAGGPLRLLDIAGLRHAAAIGAGLRHQRWAHVVHGTKSATPWPVFLQRHLTDPSTYPIDKAEADFERQPRVLAMRLHNAATYDAVAHLDPHELEVLQAGPASYQHFHALWSTCLDAILTADGTRLAPASGHLADWVTYLDRASRYLDGLDDAQRLIAVAL